VGLLTGRSSALHRATCIAGNRWFPRTVGFAQEGDGYSWTGVAHAWSPGMVY